MKRIFFVKMIVLTSFVIFSGCKSGEKRKDKDREEVSTSKSTLGKSDKKKDEKKRDKNEKNAVQKFSAAPRNQEVDEPAFCRRLLSDESIVSPVPGIDRGATIKLGNTLINGLPIGKTANENIGLIAKKFSHQIKQRDNSSCALNVSHKPGQILTKNDSPSEAVNKCTFYFNRGSKNGKKTYNWFHVGRPNKNKTNINEYLDFFGGKSFKFDLSAQESAYNEAPYPEGTEYNPHHFYACLAKGQVTMGCDGMKHRGPTFVGMLLSYAGCNAQTTEDFIFSIWGYDFPGSRGKDGSQSLRLPYFREARKLGKSANHLEQSKKIRESFEGKNEMDINQIAAATSVGCPNPKTSDLERSVAENDEIASKENSAPPAPKGPESTVNGEIADKEANIGE